MRLSLGGDFSLNIRYPVVAGYFYPEDPEKLRETIEWAFKHQLGPGRLPVVSSIRDKSVIGYVSPHAGYIYSGPVAAHVYHDIARHGTPETIIIIGTNHTGMGALISVYPSGKWVTPLGELLVDEELARTIVNNSNLAELDVYAHVEEHSVEVQLPFLQYMFGDKIRIVPIVLGLHTPEVARDMSKAIYEAIQGTGRDALVIASSDFNHYDPHEITVEKDKKVIDRILALDTDGFYKVLLEEHDTACGPGGIMTLIELSKLISENSRAELLKYATSGDVSGDKSAVVGYAAIRFLRS